MKNFVEKYEETILKEFFGLELTIIAYGSNCYGNCNSDLDICIITEKDITNNIKLELINKTINYNIKNGIKIDEEIPYENKLVFSKKQFERLAMTSPFLKDDGKYHISDIEKSKEYLKSDIMQHRLVVNILTTEHIVLCGDEKFINYCADVAWKELIEALITYYSLSTNIDEEDFIQYMYINPHTGAEGEYYLGYKKNYPNKEYHLRKSVKKYLDEYKKCIINVANNVNPYLPTPSMLAELQKCITLCSNYPENKDITIRKVISDFFSIPFERVLMTNGAMEGIHLLISQCSEKNPAIMQPSFWGYENRFEKLEIPVKKYLINNKQYKKQINAICKKHDCIVLCNPNNPTLIKLNCEELLELIKENRHCHFIIDETLLTFSNTYLENSLVSKIVDNDNLSIILSMSKISGMCSLRCGILFSSEKRIRDLEKHRALYSSNFMCQVIFTKFLKDILSDKYWKGQISEAFILMKKNLCNRKIKNIVDIGMCYILIEFNEDVEVKVLKEYLEKNKIIVAFPYETYSCFPKTILRISACKKNNSLYIANIINKFLLKE